MTMSARTTDRRKKVHALLLVVIGLYGAFFSLVVFMVGRDRSGEDGESRSSNAIAKNITCTPNWLVLGVVSKCRATVVTSDGRTYAFSSFTNELSADDVGQEVAMTEHRGRGYKAPPTGSFHPSRIYRRNTFGMLFLGLGSVCVATVGPLVMWPRKPRPVSAQ
jgi:hypothetical protein